MSVIHFKVVALLVASMPPRHTWPLSLYVAQGHSASCLVPRQPHSPPPTAEILLPIGKWGEVGARASQLSIIPVCHPSSSSLGHTPFPSAPLKPLIPLLWTHLPYSPILELKQKSRHLPTAVLVKGAQNWQLNPSSSFLGGEGESHLFFLFCKLSFFLSLFVIESITTKIMTLIDFSVTQYLFNK